jgi:CBS domain-containing protein
VTTLTTNHNQSDAITVSSSYPDGTITFPNSMATLRALSPAAAEELTQNSQTITLKPGEILFSAGETFKEAVFIVAEGQVELAHPGETPVLLEPGYLLGIANYFDATPYLATATAISDVMLQVLPTERIRAAEQRYPALFSAVNRLLTERIRSQAVQPRGVWALPARAIIQSPLVTCPPSATVEEAFATMNQRRIGSLGVVNTDQSLLGLITFVSLAEGLISNKAKANDTVVDTVCEAAHLISADAPLWKVQSEQIRLGSKYLVVMEDNKPVGVISQTDVLYTLVSYQRSVIVQVVDSKDFQELKTFSARLGAIARELRENNRSAGLAVRALSEIHLAIQRRCIELVLAELRGEDRGEPPVPFAFIIMGSGGRKEMMIKTDQDNGIILADKPNTSASETKEWFMDFCDRVNHRLDEVGYDWCTGDIMARNPDFHRSLTDWQQQISRIAEIPSEKTARWSTIVFDFETLYGDDRLTVALRNHLFQELKRKPRLLRLMVADDATGGPAIGFFNRLVTASDKERRGKIDLKRNGTRILADAARIYALSEGIAATNTGDRLSALVRQGRFDSAFIESVLAAYDELLDLTLGHQLRQLEQGKPLDKLLELTEITPLQEESLRMAMRVIKHLQGRMQGDFGTIML